jgi:hypothetical protein
MLGASGQGYRAQIFDPVAKKGLTIPFTVQGSSIELKYSSSVTPVPKAFDYVFAVRKFGNYGASGGEVAIDKAPNQGYFTFSDGKTRLISVTATGSKFIVKQRYEGRMIDAHSHATQWSRSWMLETCELYRKVGVDRVIFFDGDEALEAYRLRSNAVIPSLYVMYMNRTETLKAVDVALKNGFLWVGEALLRHQGVTSVAADDPVAMQIYDLCAKYQVPITIHQDPAEYKGAYDELERAMARSPYCIFILHGWWLSSTQLEQLIIRNPNLYVELAGELETSAQEFLGGTTRDQFAYQDGRMREEWLRFFEKYSDRVINGFDIFTQSAYSYDNLKMRVDYFRNLFGQISQKAAEAINYKNVEDLLARRICLMNVSLSSSSVRRGDTLTINAQLRDMEGKPIKNETISFFLESSDARFVSVGEAKTDVSGFASFRYEVTESNGQYMAGAYHQESTSYSYRSARTSLVVS